MRVVYANALYRHGDTRGRNAHIAQFIAHSVALGHEIWAGPGNEHPAVCQLSRNRVKRWQELRSTDVLYIRLQEKPPAACRYSLAPYRQIIGSPLLVWEFNTIPEFGYMMGKEKHIVQESIEAFKNYGRGCDLAVCVTQELSDYTQTKLGIQHVITVPNGSDPDLFHPDTRPIAEAKKNDHSLNVAWMGSAELAWHNLDLVLDTAERLWRDGFVREFTFHIIGRTDGLERKSISPNVLIHGGFPYEEIPNWLAAMDIGLCLYRSGPADFGSPLKLFDYMASGLVVIGSQQPQIKRVFEQLGQSDLLITNDSPEALAIVLLDLAADRARIRELGQASRQLIIDQYNWQSSVREIYAEIDRII